MIAASEWIRRCLSMSKSLISQILRIFSKFNIGDLRCLWTLNKYFSTTWMTMRKIMRCRNLNIAILLTLMSCGQKSTGIKSQNDGIASDSQKESSKEDSAVFRGREKHETFNAALENVPENVQAFIPAGYSAINICSGDANLDGLRDRILVLRKNSEETSSDNA